MRNAIEYIERIDNKLSPIKVARERLPGLWKEDSDIIILTLVKTKLQTHTFGGSLLNEPHDVDVFYSYIMESELIVKKYVDSYIDESQKHRRVSSFENACDWCGNRYYDITAWGRLDDGWFWKDGDKMPIEYVCECGNRERQLELFESSKNLYPFLTEEEAICKDCGTESRAILHWLPCPKCGWKTDHWWSNHVGWTMPEHDECPVCESKGDVRHEDEEYEYILCETDGSSWKKPKPRKCDRCDKVNDTWKTVKARIRWGETRKMKLCEVCRGEVTLITNTVGSHQ
jgi:hypothetical protein